MHKRKDRDSKRSNTTLILMLTDLHDPALVPQSTKKNIKKTTHNPCYSTSWTDYISQPLQIQPLTIAAFSPSQPPQLTRAELLNLPVGHARNVGIGFQRGLIRFTVKADAIRRGICLMGENIRRVKGFLHVILSYRIYIYMLLKIDQYDLRHPKTTFWYHMYMGGVWKARNYGMESDHEGVYVGERDILYNQGSSDGTWVHST